jgi:hypothetical protein
LRRHVATKRGAQLEGVIMAYSFLSTYYDQERDDDCGAELAKKKRFFGSSLHASSLSAHKK